MFAQQIRVFLSHEDNTPSVSFETGTSCHQIKRFLKLGDGIENNYTKQKNNNNNIFILTQKVLD